MAKKKVIKKTVKKATKKSVKKPIKKAVKKLVKKTAKKLSKKKVNQSKKKSVTKVSKKIAKKPAKKINVKKITKTPLKKSKKMIAKKAVKKLAKPAMVKMQIIEPVPQFVAHQTSLVAGLRAPYFEGKDQNGNLVSSDSLKGKTIILYFYPKDDTPGCTAQACSLRDEYQHLSNNNYAVVGVSADDEISHTKFANKYDLPFPLIADTDMNIIKAYDVWGAKQLMGKRYDGIVRTTFIINAEGVITEVINKVNTDEHAQQILSLNA
jgi:peroxiredoxin Q/BCP